MIRFKTNSFTRQALPKNQTLFRHKMNTSDTDEGKWFKRRKSELMISELERRHVRVLSNNTDIRRNRVPISRIESGERINVIKSRLIGYKELNKSMNILMNLSSSQPYLANPDKLHAKHLFNVSCKESSSTKNSVCHPENFEVHNKMNTY